MRTCDGCGTKMPAFKPRQRGEDGQLLCEGCTNGRPGRPVGHHGSRLACQACGTPMGEDGLVVTAGVLRCPDGCKTAGPKENRPRSCPECNGNGQRNKERCSLCNGRGEVSAATYWEWDRGAYPEDYTASKKTAATWFEDVPGEVYSIEVEDVGQARVDMELEGNPLAPTGRWEWTTFPYAWRDPDGGHPDEPRQGEEGFASSLDEAKRRAEESLRGGQMTLGSKTAGYVDDVSDCPACHGTGKVDGKMCTRCYGSGEETDGDRAVEAAAHTARMERLAVLRKQAHDSGDGATIFHCPFCGAGQVTARSDGTVECGFCRTYFTVQVQPQHAAMPQTDPKTGQPLNMPGMPGDPTKHVAPTPAPKPEDPGFAPEGSGGDEGFAPAGTKGAQFLPAGTGNHVAPAKAASKTAADTQHDLDRDDIACETCNGSGEVPDDDAGADKANDDPDYPNKTCPDCEGRGTKTATRKVAGPACPTCGGTRTYPSQGRIYCAACSKFFDKTSVLYLTPDGVAIPEKSYLAHLALRFADDREAVLTAVRNERVAR